MTRMADDDDGAQVPPVTGGTGPLPSQQAGLSDLVRRLRAPKTDDPAFRILHNDLHVLSNALDAHRQTLAEFIVRQAALLDTRLVEGGTARFTGPFQFTAQTHDVEIIESIFVWLPATVANATLTLDDQVIPLMTNATNPAITRLENLGLPVRSDKRILTFDGSNTVAPYVLLVGRASPANIPGVLH